VAVSVYATNMRLSEQHVRINTSKLRTSTSCARWLQLFSRSTFWWSRAKLPGPSVFQKIRVHAFCVYGI